MSRHDILGIIIISVVILLFVLVYILLFRNISKSKCALVRKKEEDIDILDDILQDFDKFKISNINRLQKGKRKYSSYKDYVEGKKVNIASLRDSRRKVILFEDKLELASPDTQVYVTISSRIQAGAEHILREGAKNFGAKNGSVVAMDIKTGEIILAASVNGFDPHNYWKYQPSSWVNHGFNYVFEPGSIFKTVAFSYLYNSNKLDRNRLIDTSKKITIGKYTYSDTKYYGTLTVDEVFTHSSNIGMTQLIRGENSNRKGFYDFLVNAGFGEKTGVYGANEESGIVKPVDLWSKTSLTSMAIGYEVLVTPLQVVRFYAAVANDGVMVNPKIISKIVKGNETAIPEHTEKQIMSKETASYMLDLKLSWWLFLYYLYLDY